MSFVFSARLGKTAQINVKRELQRNFATIPIMAMLAFRLSGTRANEVTFI
jgi:hypothetical protein